MRLSVLDQSPISAGSTGRDALANSIDLARLADDLGYHRYWVAEHHGGPMLAGPAPEVLIGPLAAATKRIRVGSGGVMLPHYSPLKVAEAFSLLAGLYPGRIDLGLGRAAGTDPMTTYALQRDRRQAAPDDFFDQLVELIAYLDDALPADHPFARLARSLPGRPEAPEPWLLGSSPQSAIWAAQLGLPYAFADFINQDGAGIATDYQRRFDPGVRLAAPRTAVACWALAAETEEEARFQFSSRARVRLLRDLGVFVPLDPPAVAAGHPYTDAERARMDQMFRDSFVGTGTQVAERIAELAKRLDVQEVAVVTWTYDEAVRRQSYTELAKAF